MAVQEYCALIIINISLLSLAFESEVPSPGKTSDQTLSQCARRSAENFSVGS